MSTPSQTDERLFESAVAWHEALKADDADWDGYIAWLEADPRHRKAFDEVSLIDRLVDERVADLRPLTSSPQDEQQRRPTRRRWIIGSLAAAAAGALAVAVTGSWPAASDVIYANGPGQSRRVSLAGGATVELAPSSRLLARAGDATNLELEKGEAYFAVDHDPARRLAIRAGDYSISDIGTKFAVNLSPGFVTVAVAEGHVAVAPKGGDAATVTGGQQLIAERSSATARIAPIAADNVGSWRGGRLVYTDAPLDVVATDLARYSGMTVSIDPALKDRQFSGVLTIGDGSKLFRDLSDLMAIAYRTQGRHVRLAAAADR